MTGDTGREAVFLNFPLWRRSQSQEGLEFRTAIVIPDAPAHFSAGDGSKFGGLASADAGIYICLAISISFNPAMARVNIHKILNFCIAVVWLANGLFCKLLNLVPRHEMIVARILGNEHGRLFTVLIGVAETGIALWVLSEKKAALNAFVQMALVAIMNSIEFFLAADLLLWGRMNAGFALLFILVVYYNTFHLNKTPIAQT